MVPFGRQDHAAVVTQRHHQRIFIYDSLTSNSSSDPRTVRSFLATPLLRACLLATLIGGGPCSDRSMSGHHTRRSGVLLEIFNWWRKVGNHLRGGYVRIEGLVTPLESPVWHTFFVLTAVIGDNSQFLFFFFGVRTFSDFTAQHHQPYLLPIMATCGNV